MQFELLLSYCHADSAGWGLNIFKANFIKDSLDVLEAELLLLLRIWVFDDIGDNYCLGFLARGHQVFECLNNFITNKNTNIYYLLQSIFTLFRLIIKYPWW